MSTKAVLKKKKGKNVAWEVLKSVHFSWIPVLIMRFAALNRTLESISNLSGMEKYIKLKSINEKNGGVRHVVHLWPYGNVMTIGITHSRRDVAFEKFAISICAISKTKCLKDWKIEAPFNLQFKLFGPFLSRREQANGLTLHFVRYPNFISIELNWISIWKEKVHHLSDLVVALPLTQKDKPNQKLYFLYLFA